MVATDASLLASLQDASSVEPLAAAVAGQVTENYKDTWQARLSTHRQWTVFLSLLAHISNISARAATSHMQRCRYSVNDNCGSVTDDYAETCREVFGHVVR